MNILVPTDFSKPSRVAAQYAARLAKRLDAKLVLLHIVDAPGSQRTLLKWQKLRDAMVEIAEKDGGQMVAALRKLMRGSIYLSFEVEYGFPVKDVVKKAVKKWDADLVVMGTRGASGLKKVLMGSNAAAVIDSCPVPVIVVPEETTYRDIRRIVHSTDLKHLHKEMKELAGFAQLFEASIEVMHVTSPGAKPVKSTKIQEALQKKSGYPRIRFTVLEEAPVARAINGFVLARKADLLAMFTHQLSLREKLFNQSITRQMAYHLNVPLLALHKG